MPGFDFSVLGRISGFYMDTDEMDIYRPVETLLPDGSVSVELPDTPLYAGIPCHVSFGRRGAGNYRRAGSAADSPVSDVPGTDPTAVFMTVNFNILADVQNRDVIRARKLSPDGAVLGEYLGAAGMPDKSQSRQECVVVFQKIS